MEPFFIEAKLGDGKSGRLFAVYHPPRSANQVGGRGGVLIVPPFAEELNRSRHMMAAAARALAARGFGVLILDLYGTGDSEGRFEDARLDHWRGDLDRAASAMEDRGQRLTGVLALRLGALLTLDWLHHGTRAPATLVFWGAVLSGNTFINQFLRLRVAESMARSGGTKETTKDLKARLDRGEMVEVGGYGLTAPMTEAIEALKASDLPPPGASRTHFMELGANLDGPAPALEKLLAAWDGARFHAVDGPAFWTLLEPVHVPGLITATVDIFDGAPS